MAEDKKSLNFYASEQEANYVDQMVAEDGYENRSAWLRRLVRQEIAKRFGDDVAKNLYLESLKKGE